MYDDWSRARLTRRRLLGLMASSAVGFLASHVHAATPPVPKAIPEPTPTGSAPLLAIRQVLQPLIKPQRPLRVLYKKDFFPAYNDLLKSEIAQFCEDRGWPLEISFVSDYTDGVADMDKIAAAVRAGDAPDLVLDTLPVTNMAERNCLESVTEIVSDLRQRWGEPSDSATQACYSRGNWWGVPYHHRSRGSWYRADIWHDSGIDLQSIRTYPALAEACLAVSAPDQGIYGWGVTPGRSSDGLWFVDRVIAGWGGRWQDRSGRYVTIDSEETVAALSWLVDIYRNPKWENMLPPRVLAWNDLSNNQAYMEGRLAYTQNCGALYVQMLLEKSPLAPVTSFHLPVGGPRMTDFCQLDASNWMILRGASHLQEAMEIIAHLTLDLGCLDSVFEAAPGFALPCYVDLWDLSQYLRGNEIALQQKSAAINPHPIIPWIYPGPPSAAVNQVRAMGIQEDLVSAVLAGRAVSDAIRTAQTRAVGVFRAHGLPGDGAPDLIEEDGAAHPRGIAQ